MVISTKTKPNNEKDLYSILNPLMKKWFKGKFKEFAIPQKYSVFEIHSRKNILVSSPTGSGKTLTGFLSVLNELIDSSLKKILEDRIYCVYVSPLKALSQDVKKNLIEPLQELEKLHGMPLNIRVGVRTGDTTQKEKSYMLKNPPHIFITTPESLGIALTSPKFRNHLRKVEWFILDEVHALAENKRGVDLSLGMERLQYLSPGMTRVGLSATVAPLEEVAKFLAGSTRDCLIVDVQYLKLLDLKVLSPVPDLIDTTFKIMHDKMYKLIHDLISKHTTTLIFTNTRAATERVVHNLKEKYPSSYIENIGAHHGSLSAEHRTDIETKLREGKLKVVVCSTSLELGIDIGFIDLVILLGSPKSVARCLQRVGRSGHQLHATTKGRIIVLNRDDLVECSVLLKSAVEKTIDTIHIPKNALDVLSQQIIGMAIEQDWHEDTLYEVITRSYCFKDLKKHDFYNILDFLSGKFVALEDRHVYARIYHEDKRIRRRGKLARVIYMTNLGTIPDQSGIIVKCQGKIVGKIDEGFLERLRKNDIFVLGGNTYRFNFARGMVAEVLKAVETPPTVPSWISENLPLSFDLSLSICKFRRFMLEKFEKNSSKKDFLDFLEKYLYIGDKAGEALYSYFEEQYQYLKIIPNDRLMLIEHYFDNKLHSYVFHSLYGRRVNDVLSRGIAYLIAKSSKRDVEISINDHGFALISEKELNVKKAIEELKKEDLPLLMKIVIDKTEVLRRRFRHCAGRSFMILRTYMGKKKRVGRQQVSSQILLSAVRKISEDFPILAEAKREVLSDLMDLENANKIVTQIDNGRVKIKYISTTIPSPFALNIALQGVTDILKIEDRIEYLKRMHEYVKAKIALNTKTNINQNHK